MSLCSRRLSKLLTCTRRAAFSSTCVTTDDRHAPSQAPSSSDLPRTSRRLAFEYPGENIGCIASYLKGTYPGWSAHFHPQLQVSKWQRQVMFEKECEKAMFAQDPREHDMETLGFSREFEVREPVVKIEEQCPTDYVLYHDMGEMWKRRQSMDIPFINVGSFVEVTLRSKWDLTRPVTYGGIVTEKSHRDLNAFFIIRKHVASYGYGVENYVPMYSPFLESVKVISYQVRDDPCKERTLHSLRDLAEEQTQIEDPKYGRVPEPTFDNETNLEIPYFRPLVLEYKPDKIIYKKQKRFMKSSTHLRPRRADTSRNYKLWETDYNKRYPRKNVLGKKYKE